MLEHLEQIESRYNEIATDLTKQEVLNDIKRTRELSKELSELEEVVNCFKSYKKILRRIIFFRRTKNNLWKRIRSFINS